jgi:hypothetical protein
MVEHLDELKTLKTPMANEIFSSCMKANHRITKDLCRFIASRLILKVLVKKTELSVKNENVKT